MKLIIWLPSNQYIFHSLFLFFIFKKFQDKVAYLIIKREQDAILKLQIQFGGDIHEIVVPTNGDPTVAELETELEKQFHVPKETQRLIFRGQALHEKPDYPLSAFGIKNSNLIRMIGRKGVLEDDNNEGQ